MEPAHAACVIEIGNRAGDLENAVIATRRKLQFDGRVGEQGRAPVRPGPQRARYHRSAQDYLGWDGAPPFRFCLQFQSLRMGSGAAWGKAFRSSVLDGVCCALPSTAGRRSIRVGVIEAPGLAIARVNTVTGPV